MLYTALTCEKFSKRVMKLIMAMMLVLIMLLMVATMVLVVMVMTVMKLVVLVVLGLVLLRKKLEGKDIRTHLLPQIFLIASAFPLLFSPSPSLFLDPLTPCPTYSPFLPLLLPLLCSSSPSLPPSFSPNEPDRPAFPWARCLFHASPGW